MLVTIPLDTMEALWQEYAILPAGLQEGDTYLFALGVSASISFPGAYIAASIAARENIQRYVELYCSYPWRRGTRTASIASSNGHVNGPYPCWLQETQRI
jgi:hypothetical protein